MQCRAIEAKNPKRMSKGGARHKPETLLQSALPLRVRCVAWWAAAQAPGLESTLDGWAH